MKRADNEKPVIFISWSGKKTPSFRMAETLKSVLELVFHSEFEIFLSTDIEKGIVSIQEICENLSKAKIGIICVTKNNVEKPWLNFEAGALMTAVYNKQGKAMPLLLDMNTDQFSNANSPLRNLQATELNEADLLMMFNDLNRSLINPLSEKQIQILFNQIAKDTILACDVTLSESVEDNDSSNPNSLNDSLFQSSDPLTKDCRKLLKRIYTEYLTRRSNGASRVNALTFGSPEDISKLSEIPLDDVNYLLDELCKHGYYRFVYADSMTYYSTLTEKGIKYCEDKLDEPTYVQALRYICKISKEKNNHFLSSNELSMLKAEDIDTLETKGYIKKQMYIHGGYSIKPTISGISFINEIDQ